MLSYISATVSLFQVPLMPSCSAIAVELKNVSSLIADSSLTILKTSIRSAHTLLNSKVHNSSSLSLSSYVNFFNPGTILVNLSWMKWVRKHSE